MVIVEEKLLLMVWMSICWAESWMIRNRYQMKCGRWQWVSVSDVVYQWWKLFELVFYERIRSRRRIPFDIDCSSGCWVYVVSWWWKWKIASCHRWKTHTTSRKLARSWRGCQRSVSPVSPRVCDFSRLLTEELIENRIRCSRQIFPAKPFITDLLCSHQSLSVKLCT